VFAEQQSGKAVQVAFELIGKARELADIKKCGLAALLVGDHVAGQAQALIEAGADLVLMCEHPALGENPEMMITDIVCGAAERLRPETLLFGATGLGRSLAPRVAARLRTGLTADCTALSIDEESGFLKQTRPAFGGNLMADILCPDHRPQMATVRPGVMVMPEMQPGRKGRIERLIAPQTDGAPVRVLEQINQARKDGVSGAQVIVSAGRGIESKKNMALVYELASLLGAEVGVSRALVDMGWGEYRQQIGQTGCSVSPRLLIACGISGAVQHMAGIGGAKTIVAINKDPEARIFSAADVAVVGDCAEVLGKLIALLKA
jgi:electron transfer flavoprotein alpha subunit